MTDVMVVSIPADTNLWSQARMMIRMLQQVGGDLSKGHRDTNRYVVLGTMNSDHQSLVPLGTARTPQIARAMMDVVFAFGGYAEVDYCLSEACA